MKLADAIEACRKASAQPVLPWLSFVEKLEIEPVSRASAWKELSGLDPTERSTGVLLQRVFSVEHWLGVPPSLEAMYLESAARPWWRTDRWVAELVEQLPRYPSEALAKLAAEKLPASWPGWERIVALLAHDDRDVRHQAARMALVAGRIEPQVVHAIREYLADITGTVDDDYDRQVEGEQLLAAIAAAGPQLATLALSLTKLLSSKSPAWRSFAAEAAGSLGEVGLVPALERLVRENHTDNFAIAAVRGMAHLALWQLTRPRDHLDAALDDFERGGSIFRYRAAEVFRRTSSDERTFEDLLHVSQRSLWYDIACETFAAAGPAAAAMVSRLGPPPVDECVGVELANIVARWRVGLADAAATAKALHPLLETDVHAWEPYVATSAGTSEWRATIRAALHSDQARFVLEGFSATPGLAKQFLPDLVAANHDTYVESLFVQMPRDEFWSAVRA